MIATRLRAERLSTLSFAASLSFVLAACSSDVRGPIGVQSDKNQGPALRGGVLHTASYTDVRSLDAAVAFDESANAIEQLIYAKLVEFSPDGKGVMPDLAERWEVQQNAQRYVFFLREGLHFHDGSPLVAADIKRSIERALSPDTPCPVAGFYERIRGFDEFTKGKSPHLEGVKVEGELTIAIELAEPDATLLAVMALPTVAAVCPSAGTTYDPDFSRKACGAGPFKLKRWEPGVIIQVERFEGYYAPDLVHLDGIDWLQGVPSFTQRLKFERGELDFMREFTEPDGRLYRSHPLWKGRGEWEPSKGILGISMNTEMEPFRNIELRRAVVTAIDRDQVAKVRPGQVQPASRIIPPAIPGYDPTPGQRFDYAEALDHMRKAGYPFDPATGRGGYPTELTFMTLNESFYTQAAEVYQQQLARIGIKLRIKSLGWPAYLAVTARRGASMWGSDGWNADFPDPSDFFEPILTSKVISDEDSQNRAFFSNDQFDRIVADARREVNGDRRRALYREAEQVLFEQAPWAFVYTYRYWEVWHPYVHGYHIHPSLSQHVGGAWIDVAARGLSHEASVAPPLSRARLAWALRSNEIGARP